MSITSIAPYKPLQAYEVHALLNGKTIHVYRTSSKYDALKRVKTLYDLELETMLNFNV